MNLNRIYIERQLCSHDINYVVTYSYKYVAWVRSEGMRCRCRGAGVIQYIFMDPNFRNFGVRFVKATLVFLHILHIYKDGNKIHNSDTIQISVKRNI